MKGTSKENFYKGNKKTTQPLEEDHEMNVLHCPYKERGCKHKGFRIQKCLDNHIKKKHNDNNPSTPIISKNNTTSIQPTDSNNLGKGKTKKKENTTNRFEQPRKRKNKKKRRHKQ